MNAGGSERGRKREREVGKEGRREKESDRGERMRQRGRESVWTQVRCCSCVG